jgi:hypothetical protein
MSAFASVQIKAERKDGEAWQWGHMHWTSFDLGDPENLRRNTAAVVEAAKVLYPGVPVRATIICPACNGNGQQKRLIRDSINRIEEVQVDCLLCHETPGHIYQLTHTEPSPTTTPSGDAQS